MQTYEDMKKDTTLHSEITKIIHLKRENGSWKILFPDTVLESLRKEVGVEKAGPMPAPSMDTYLLEPRIENYIYKIINDYVDIKNLKRVLQKPYIRGKAVIIDFSARRPHELHYAISPDVIAKNPEEVGTIILINSSSKYTGEYSGLKDNYFSLWKGYVSVWKVTITDRLLNTIVSEEVFQGPDLPVVVKGVVKDVWGGTQFGSAEEAGITITHGRIIGKPPIDEVKNYIQKLPRH